MPNQLRNIRFKSHSASEFDPYSCLRSSGKGAFFAFFNPKWVVKKELVSGFCEHTICVTTVALNWRKVPRFCRKPSHVTSAPMSQGDALRFRIEGGSFKKVAYGQLLEDFCR